MTRSNRTARLVLTGLAGLGLLALALPASAATITASATRVVGNWSNPALWAGGVVPGAEDWARVGNTSDVTIDAAAPSHVGRIGGNHYTVRLTKDFSIGDFYFREGFLVDNGHDLTVTGTLSNSDSWLAWVPNGGGVSSRTGGNLFLNVVTLGRSNLIEFRSGDTIAGNVTTSMAFNVCPQLVVRQDPQHYSDRIGEGLSLAAGSALSLCTLTTLTLHWDAGITGPGTIDWTLRWGGDHVDDLRARHAAGKLRVGTLPIGETFSPTEHIFYDANDGYTYVGFRGEHDSDGDGVGDGSDSCPGFDDRDDQDADGVADACDECTGFPNVDFDLDGDCDAADFCPTDPQNRDSDDDLVCDVDDLCQGDNVYGDADGDQVCEDLDVCLGNDIAGDTDSDVVCDDLDNCPNDANGDQSDADGDGIGTACEADSDQDGTIDDLDNCVSEANIDQANSDDDGLGDVCDADDDNDGIDDPSDNCPLYASDDQSDFDADGVGDVCDGDDDADAVADGYDLCPGTPMSVLIDAHGCSGSQYVTLQVGSCSHYNSKGGYVAAVTQAANKAVAAGLLTSKEKGAITSAAAKSTC
jgi:hypothetical protein